MSMSKIQNEIESSVFEKHKETLKHDLMVEYFQITTSKQLGHSDLEIEFLGCCDVKKYSLDMQSERFLTEKYHYNLPLPDPNRGGCMVSGVKAKNDYGYDYQEQHVANASEIKIPDNCKGKKISIGYILQDTERIVVSF
jgi:hypothetical protein